eukprot:TRINITY_DN2497_c0_g1_i3.p2 TRINITY_DN2497_c0_g1~~TRINITY_DN2497_c0_g1_i3.p2  ORF type:complete len:422 (+),score=51.76 TRINITY_DN2497_c0_g1_i3:28-1293(+)
MSNSRNLSKFGQNCKQSSSGQSIQMRGRRAAAGLAAVAATGFLLRKFQPETYNRLFNFVNSIASITYNSCLALAGSLEISAILLKDFVQYLKSDDEELPQSLIRMLALLRSRDVLYTYQSFISSSVDGFMESDIGQKLFVEDTGKPTALDKILTALLSEPGQNLVGLAVQMATKTTVETFATSVDLKDHLRQSSIVREILDWLNTPRAQQLVSHTTTAAVSTGVAAYMDSAQTKTNPYENLLSALSQPQHAEVTRQLLQAIIREAIISTAIQIRNKPYSPQGSPHGSRTASPGRDKRTLAVPDIQLVNSPQNNPQMQNTLQQQISYGLAAIGSRPEAREFVVSMASQVTGAGIRSMIFSALDVIKGRGEFESLQQHQDGKLEVKEGARTRAEGLPLAIMMTVLMALVLHISMFPVPFLSST